MNLPLYDVFGIGETIENFIRGLFWGIIKVLMSMVTGMLDALINGVLSFGVLSSTWVSDGFKAALAIMFLVLPVKIIYEILFALLTDNEQAMNVEKKLFGCITAVILAIALPTAVPLANNLTVKCAKVMTTDIGTKETKLGNALLSSVFVGFGGMAEEGPSGANTLVKNYQKESFSITERNDDDSYVWQFSEFMVIIGMAIYVILLFATTIQIATRIFMIALLYVLGPICVTSLTKYYEPQAFNVWKNTLLGQMAMNICQILSLSFLASIVGMISNIGTDSFTGLAVTMAQLALYFGAFSLVISLPNFIQAMIGGYGAGVMEVANQMQSGLHMMKASTIGLASAGVNATIGRRNSYTGFREGGFRGAIAGNKYNDGTRRGGIIGATLGQKDRYGHRQGGLRSAIAGDTIRRGNADIQTGGFRGLFKGNVATSQNEDGSRTVTSEGGALGLFRGSRHDYFEAGSDVASTSIYSGGARSIFTGTTTVDRTGGAVTKSRSGGAYNVGKNMMKQRYQRTHSVKSSVRSGLAVQKASSIDKGKSRGN